MFTKEVKENIDPIPPSKMEKPFTHSEIEKAAKSMKNGKSVGEDKLNAEYVKYGPTAIHQGIADILNYITETWKHPKEIKSGILTPLPKPGKKQGPPSNLRPIILLSTLRKILAICMIKRCWNRFKTKIPLEQAAYQEGRSTTEHVLAVKLLCEKAITSCDYNLCMKLLDMSKAFDTVSRMKLLHDLKHLLEPDEYHMLSILILDVRLKVRVGDQEGEEIITEVGITQGDCLSAILFILYLAITLNGEEPTVIPTEHHDHTYNVPQKNYINTVIPTEHQDHNYYVPQKNYITIDPKYADDITYLTTCKERNEKIEEDVPPMLQERDLFVNKDKTETEVVSRGGTTEWKNIKFLGSLLDTESDINRRKGLAICACNTYQDILYKNKNSLNTKLRVFRAYVASIFLYNSEVWTLTVKLNHKIDVFQRTLLRRILKIKWSRRLSNSNLYKFARCEPWSITIKRRRLSFLGHTMRLHPDTPARQAIAEFLRPVRRPPGRPTKTWMECIRTDLKEMDINLNFKRPEETIELLELHTHNRESWRAIWSCAQCHAASAANSGGRVQRERIEAVEARTWMDIPYFV